jgi:catechol 2,3-dioxygenase-like lactoylglutathione lyase family enzyme
MYRSLRVRRTANPVVGHVGLEAMRKRSRKRRVIAPSAASAARAFYRDALKGQQVWPAGRMGGRGTLWFRVAGALIEVVGAAVSPNAPVMLDVDDPNELAQRCWDAGFTVRMHQDATGRAPLSVFDPFGRRIDLAPRECVMNAHRFA